MEATDPITQLNAALDGRYRIERELGEGGMARVYLAEDLRHGREVALKVLRPELAAVVGADRFLAEIRTTANLQHPHILPLFDSGEAAGLLFYVMPYVKGESLAERLERERQLPVDDAVRIASDVAAALDHAHRQGVVHRDVKPANILLRDGQPLVADFGIALALGVEGGKRLTETGLSPGTPQYMSPEQATGDQVIGSGTDIYSLGCVLYECLAGEPPFTGASPQAILSRIIMGSVPAITEHRSSVPPNVEAAILRALERLPADRFGSAAEFGHALYDSEFRHGESRERPGPTTRWKVATTLLGIVTAVLLVWMGWPDDTPIKYYNLNLPLEPVTVGTSASRVAISPDGGRYVFVGSGGDVDRTGLWIRDQSRARPEPLPAFPAARNPAFSPDGRSIVALQLLPGGRSRMLRARLDETAAVPLAEGELDRMGHSWGDDGYIYIGSTRGILRIPEAGGEFEVVTRVDASAGETGHHGPVVLPGGAGVVFTIRHAPFREESLYRIGVSAAMGDGHRVLLEGVRAEYAAPGVLLHVTADGRLLSTPFDVQRLELDGESTPVAEGVPVGQLGAVDLSVSDTGKLIYGAATPRPAQSELVLVSRDGNSRTLASGWTAAFRSLSLSPDGSMLAVQVGEVDAPEDPNIWVWSFDRGTRQPLTSNGANLRPVWTPGGASVAFISDRAGSSTVWQVRADGSGAPERVLDSDTDIAEAAWSADGRWLVYRTSFQEPGGGDIRSVDLANGTDHALFDSEFGEATPAVSPDGRWIAYTSFATGVQELWVASFPDARKARNKISQGGGAEPRWSRDGRELFFRDSNDDLVVVEVDDRSEPPFTEPRRLFSRTPYLQSTFSFAYDVMPDGGAFVMLRGTTSGEGPELVVIEGLPGLLRR